MLTDVSCHVATYLGNTVTVPEDDTNLRWGQTLLGQLEDLVLDLIRSELEPLGNTPPVWQSRLGNTLSWSVHTTHPEILLRSETNQIDVHLIEDSLQQEDEATHQSA